ncbi:MAG TPA: CGNR zinc finger domain-containing protein [Streptosporangiaceae bacterium]|nr:CGNR zinc finger domain-containing protein [Streptosporangiaceae bacterium]
MATQEGVLGGVHDAARRAADMLAILLPREGIGSSQVRSASVLAAERAALVAVLRAYGEPEPVEISDADLGGLRQAAIPLGEVFAAGDAATAAGRINALLAGRARPPRLTTHGGTSGWHLHVDGSDDAPWPEWFVTSSCLALAVLLAERQAPPGGFCASPSCGRPFVNTGRGAARRYCSPACGTRERVARHRTSHAAGP